MTTLKIIPNPTFEAAVDIPVHGGKSVPVKFQFRHRTKKDFAEWLEEAKSMDDATAIISMASGWELRDEFNRENIERLTDNYCGAGVAVFNKYVEEIGQARIKN